MDNAITSLTAMSLDIAGFQSQVAGLEQRVMTMEGHITTFQDRDQELLYVRSKLLDLEDRSRRNKVRFFRFPENIEGADAQSFLREVIPRLTDLAFNPPFEF
ncbi:hypothetical protein NDU88_003224 [Pleurodeles waltl]|uniref:Uncharacterized protein n=1 Tax=Pleurodeles waltl TaxID=8319 RepID=A0AAV7WRU8_PLEWA|nr:hypothetical protein NDU88_003224 [Pleurodeles waltl]